MLNFEYPCLDQIFTTKSSSTDAKTTTQSQSIVSIILVSSMIPFGLTLLSIPTIVIIVSTKMRCKFCVYIHSDMTDRLM